MKIFVDMIDAGAMLKGFQRRFGITPRQFEEHFSLLSYYRIHISTSEKISELIKSGGDNAEILRLRLLLKEEWEKRGRI